MSPERLDPAGLDAVAVDVAVAVAVLIAGVATDVAVAVAVLVAEGVEVDVDVAGELDVSVPTEARSLVVEAEPEDSPAGAVDESIDVDVASPAWELPTELDAEDAGIGWPAEPEPVVPHAAAAARRTQTPVHERSCIAIA